MFSGQHHKEPRRRTASREKLLHRQQQPAAFIASRSRAIRERIREQGRVWWALEASKGANWYLQPKISSNGGEGMIRVTSLKLSVLTNTVTLRRLIRKGVPPALRPKVWLSVSGAAKKRSTVPETYYDELIRATEGKTTPATRQIDHVSIRMLPTSYCIKPCFPVLEEKLIISPLEI
jgi:hypothetical protein